MTQPRSSHASAAGSARMPPQRAATSHGLPTTFAGTTGGVNRKVSKRLRHSHTNLALSSQPTHATASTPSTDIESKLPPALVRAKTSHSLLLGRKESLRWLRSSLPSLRSDNLEKLQPISSVPSPQPPSPAISPPTVSVSAPSLGRSHAESAYPGAAAAGVQIIAPSTVAPSRIRKRPPPLSPPERVLSLLLDHPALDASSYLVLARTSRRLHQAAMAPHRWPGTAVDWWIEDWLSQAEFEAQRAEEEGTSLCDSLLDRLFETNLVILADPDLPPSCHPIPHARARVTTESLRIHLPMDPLNVDRETTFSWLSLGRVPAALLKGAPPSLINQVASRLSRTVFARLLAREALELYPDVDPESLDVSQELAFLTRTLESDRALVLAFASGYLPSDTLDKMFSPMLGPSSAEWHPAATPLHVASARGKRDTAKLLLSLGWHPSGSVATLEEGSFDSCVPLKLAPVEHALYAGHPGTARFLISRGASTCVANRGEACPIAVVWTGIRRSSTTGDQSASSSVKSPERSETEDSPEELVAQGEDEAESFDAITHAHRGSKCLKLVLDVLRATGWKPDREKWREVGVELMYLSREPATVWTAAVKDILF